MSKHHSRLLFNVGLAARLALFIEDSTSLDKQSKATLQSICDSSKEGPLDMKSTQSIFNIIKEVLTSTTNEAELLKVLRLFDKLIPALITDIIDDLSGQQRSSIPAHQIDILFSIVLQFTSKATFTILKYYVDSKTSPFQSPFTDSFSQLKCIYRFLEAQPYFIKIWDCSPILNTDLTKFKEEIIFLVQLIRQMVRPSKETHDQLQQQKSLHNLDFVESIRINMSDERKKQEYFDKMFKGDLELISEQYQIKPDEGHKQESDKVITSYLKGKVDEAVQEMQTDIFKHFVINGDEGSGKMSFIQLLSSEFEEQTLLKNQQNNLIVVVTIDEAFDSKNLVGTYVCNEIGEFIFKKGPLTVAAEQGMWLVLRNIEKAPPDLLSFLLPLVQENQIQISSRFTIIPKLGFRIIIISRSSIQKTQNQNEPVHSTHQDTKPFLDLLYPIHLERLDQRLDFQEILKAKYRHIYSIEHVPQMIFASIDFLKTKLNQLKTYMLDSKPFSVRQIFKAFQRINEFLKHSISEQEIQIQSQGGKQVYISSHWCQVFIQELTDIYLAFIYDKQIRLKLIQELVQTVWNNSEVNKLLGSSLDPTIVSEYITSQNREWGINKKECYFGRSKPMKIISEESKDESEHQSSNFVFTATTLRLLEQLTQCINNTEPLLLVGETGTGKTTAVQELAKIIGKKLHVFNMSQNTDSADLLGGFKPVDIKYIMRPLYELFLSTFKALYNAEKNQKFLDIMHKCYAENKMKDFIQCIKHGIQYITQKQEELTKATKDKKTKEKLDYVVSQKGKLEQMVFEASKRIQKMENSMGGSGFIFQFIEGTLIKSIQNGDWILLDEINLANETLLNRLSTLIEGQHILLNERGDLITTQMHKDFRLFFCMNPPYTSAAKKQLPWEIRQRVTEIYVDELDKESDIWMIIDKKAGNQISEHNYKRRILEFYMKIRGHGLDEEKPLNVNFKKNHIGGLRNLSRAIQFMNSATQLSYPVIKAIYDGLSTCFASHLEKDLSLYVHQLILDIFNIEQLPTLSISQQNSKNKNDDYVYISDFVIKKGIYPPQGFDPKEFVTTASFNKLLKQVASIVAITNYAIILQGPTSVGKTSTVQYLAAITNNKVIRINNHMHTDIQEYIGQYVPDKNESGTGSGKLVFQEGVLVEAVRNGYWVILDELNLAPSEVLEALNRLLDDNRELHIVETQQVIKAHPNFRIFATQNPTQGYGGRKELSEAFKNRFIMIQVNEVPLNELVEILIHKCEVPKSRAELMVRIMEQLQIFRGGKGNVFAGKDANITVRDLLKWAQRLRIGKLMTVQDVAMEGFLVLGERARYESDKQFIKETIEKVSGVKINEKEYYHQYFKSNIETKLLQFQFGKAEGDKTPKLILSQQLQRLAVLMHKSLVNSEPVLLVGETGCGKTTLCQAFASIINQQSLYSINCHQNTETSDFIGCMRTKTNFGQQQAEFITLFNQVIGELNEVLEVKLDILSYEAGKKQINTAFNNLKKVQSEHKKNTQISNILKAHIQKLKSIKIDLNCIFEWHDGILIDSMQKGGLLLIDEISLANDSVLERLNSVFEQGRTLILSEKSSSEAIIIKANPLFNIVATMNPSGDFGKKELSPALRNRMTEIWVESYFQQEELNQIPNILNVMHHSKSNDSFLIHKVDEQIDIFKIILETCKDKLSQAMNKESVKKLSLAIFNMICFVNFKLGAQYYAMQRKSLSIRDILNIIEFIHVSFEKLFNKDLVKTFIHSIELVILDGVCLGIEMVEERVKRQIIEECNTFIKEVVNSILKNEQSMEDIDSISEQVFVDTPEQLGVAPFLIDKSMICENQRQYVFQAPTTKTNLMKLLRAYQLTKPILIEGPPGVGKTSLVESLAKASGRKLIRVNLSEQTDMMDLLGSEYPVFHKDKTSNGGNSGEDDIQFQWCDGVLLQAIKEGYWFLIDEMNLAQQSILEGLNAILDHRRTVYIPELNKEFQCHPNFFVFACQNPSQSSSASGGRKTLPKSFLNRFNKIYLEDLTYEDYSIIIQRQIDNDQELSEINVQKLLKMNKSIEVLLKKENHIHPDEGAINMRDLTRFLKLYKQFRFEQNSHDISLIHAFQILYLSRLVKNKQTAIAKFKKNGLIESNPSELNFDELPLVRINDEGKILFGNCMKKTTIIQDNYSQLNASHQLLVSEIISLKGIHSLQLQYLSDCINANLPILILTNDTRSLIQNLQTIAKVSQNNLNRILLNQKSDTSQLLGCFEQTSEQSGDDEAKGTQNRFEWVDSVLIKAISSGQWVVFENVNMCNPSILDRINPLLEEGNNSLSINEQGLLDDDVIREVKAHPNFRSIFVMSTYSYNEQGKDVSRALRNRCVQIQVLYAKENFEQEQFPSYEAKIIDNKYQFTLWETQVIADSFQKQKSKITEEEKHEEKLSKKQLGKRKLKQTESTDQNEGVIRQIYNQPLSIIQQWNNKSSEQKDVLRRNKHFEGSYLFNYFATFKESQSLNTYIDFKFNSYGQYQHIKKQSNKDVNPQKDYLKYLLQVCIQKIGDHLSNKGHLWGTNQKEYIKAIISLNHEQLEQYEDAYLMLKTLKSLIKSKDTNELSSSLKLVFLLSLVLRAQPIQKSIYISDLIRKMFKRENKSQLAQIISQNVGYLDYVDQYLNLQKLGPNQISVEVIELIKHQLKERDEMSQSPLKGMFIKVIDNNMFKQGKGNQKEIIHSLQGLKGIKENFNIIGMNENKQILKEDDIDEYSLVEKLDSPYLSLIPYSQYGVMISMVNLYPFLCLLKDLKQIYQMKISPSITNKRLTALSPLLGVFNDKQELQKSVVEYVEMNNLESSYQIEQGKLCESFIQQVLDSDYATPIRHIQAQYICEQSLSKVIEQLPELEVTYNLKTVTKYPEINKISLQREKMLRQYYQNEQYNKLEDDDQLILDTALILEQITETDVIQTIDTLLLLPFETNRLRELKSLRDLEFASKLSFLHFHLRNAKSSSSQLATLKLELDDLQNSEKQLSMLKSQSDEDSKLLYQLRIYLIQVNELLMIKKDKDGELNYDEFFSLLQDEIQYHAKNKFSRLIQKMDLLNKIIIQGLQVYFLDYNNVLSKYFNLLYGLLLKVRQIINRAFQNERLNALKDTFMNFSHMSLKYTYLDLCLLKSQYFIKKNPQDNLYKNNFEYLMKFYVQYNSMGQPSEFHNEKKLTTLTFIFDYFTRREVARKMIEQQEQEEKDAKLFVLPFKMKVQDIIDGNKSYDQKTKKDLVLEEKEADLEIETNFPSYFDSYQKQLFSGQSLELQKGQYQLNQKITTNQIKQEHEVSSWKIIKEILNIKIQSINQSKNQVLFQRKAFLKTRLRITKQIFGMGSYYNNLSTNFAIFSHEGQEEGPFDWMRDIKCFLDEKANIEKQLSQGVMAIADVQLDPTYNFYHDPLPQEARLIYSPLLKLMQTVRDILSEWDSPILTDIIFIANYMLTTFILKTTPLMKVLTGLELILNKVEEWEVYASKSIGNSLQGIDGGSILNSLKQLVIRFRKIQIMSWRNLLQWKNEKMVKEDVTENFIRLVHTIEKQIFDKKMYHKEVKQDKYRNKTQNIIELKIFEILDLFIRDSSLGQFQTRVEFIKFIRQILQTKLKALENPWSKGLLKLNVKLTDEMEVRIIKVINILTFVYEYYSQFQEKLKATIKRLDIEAREKVVTLIDISKWTLQKFNVVKSNIEKVHRQLNRACKQEEEILSQNVASLILTSSRKKYIKENQHLLGLDTEVEAQSLDQEEAPSILIPSLQIQTINPQVVSLVKQLTHLEDKLILQNYPDSSYLEQTMIPVIFDRIKRTRDTNKKHIQRKAFSDLLKYLKEQGLGIAKEEGDIMNTLIMNNTFINCSSGITDSKVMNEKEMLKLQKYYYKGHEVLMMLESSGQVDEHSDLRNADINRARSFSQSMMHKIIELNNCISEMIVTYEQAHSESSMGQSFQIMDDTNSEQVSLNEEKATLFSKYIVDLRFIIGTMQEKLGIIDILEGTSLVSQLTLDAGLTESISKELTLSSQTFENVFSFINNLKERLYQVQVSTRGEKSIQRIESLMDSVIDQLCDLQEKIEDLFEEVEEEDSLRNNKGILEKRFLLFEGKVKLLYQSIVKILQQSKPEQEQGKKDSQNTVTNISSLSLQDNLDNVEAGDESENGIELNIQEQLVLTQRLREEIFENRLPEILELSKKIYTCKDVISPLLEQDVQTIMNSTFALTSKVVNICQYVLENQFTFLQSLCKFNYITLRIFVYLIYEGFCGQEEDKDESKNQQDQDDKLFENEGCGMGDGKGQDNVSKEIEHEEQVEGLKKYESDEEDQKKKDQPKDESQNEEGEEDNDFEMKEDFDGDLEEQEQPEEDKKDQEKDDIDDELDEVDEMLDNQLWNQNMEDMEEEEKKEEEKDKQKEKKEEVDLGERKLDEMNQLKEQDKEMTAGDNDKKDQNSKDEEDKGKKDEEQKEQDEMEDIEDHSRDGEEEDDGKQNDIPLDRQSNVEEMDLDEEEKKDEVEKEGEGLNEEDEQIDEENKDGEENQNSENQDGEDSGEDQQEDAEMSIDEQNVNEEDQKDQNDDQYKKDYNKQIMDDQAIEEEKKQEDNIQSNLKQKASQQNLNQKKQDKNKDDQGQNDENLESEFDISGNDILYQLTKILEQNKKDKQEQQSQDKKQKSVQEDQKAKKIDNPQMSKKEEQEKKKQEEKEQKGDEGMEYEFNEDQDDEADQLQGKLATDQIEENTLRMNNEDKNKQENDDVNMEHDQDSDDDDQFDDENEEMQESKQVIKEKAQLNQKSSTKDDEQNKKERNREDLIQPNLDEEEQEDLIQTYDQYLDKKKHSQQEMVPMERDQQLMPEESSIINYFKQNPSCFDYNLNKTVLQELYQAWFNNRNANTNDLLNKFKQATSTAAASLCEQLRIVLEPQLSQQLQGDYKTGKRLNMKKVVGFIASHYRNDRIWLRRTLPSKREYKILIAIDDSLSMKEHNLGIFSLESMVTILEALNRLEVGKVAVAGIRDRMQLFQSFEDTYSSERTQFMIEQFAFDYCAPKSSDLSMANFVRDANQMIEFQNSTGGDGNVKNYPFVIIISDGRFNKNNVRPYLREAKEKNFLYIFVILDSIKTSSQDGEKEASPQGKGSKLGKEGSIINLKSAEKDLETGNIKLVPYLKEFPFEYYCIIRDVQQLPYALGNILVQWFSMINNTSN